MTSTLTDDWDLSDPFLAHEALHASNLVLNLFNDEVTLHPYVAMQVDLFEQASRVEDEMAKLYQMIGAKSG